MRLPIILDIIYCMWMRFGKKSVDDLKVAFEDLRDLPDSEDRIKALEQMFTTAKAFMDRMKSITEGADSEQ